MRKPGVIELSFFNLHLFIYLCKYEITAAQYPLLIEWP